MAMSTARHSDTKVLLIGWAGTDWPEVEPRFQAGDMPALKGLAAAGVRGRLAPVRPYVSSMLWTSTITGKRADKHGICSIYEPLPDDTGLVPVSGLRRRAAAIWDHVTQAGGYSVVAGWPVVDAAEPMRGTILREARESRSPAWAVDPLVAAHSKELKGACNQLDASLDSVLRLHANACELLRSEPWRFAAVCYPVLASLGSAASSDPSDGGLSENRNGCAWRLQDALLAEVCRVAGPDTNVILISPHGPTPPVNRSQQSGRTEQEFGLFCAAGPQVRSGITHYGATVLDVAPTVLRLLGLVEDADSDGEPWLECLDLNGVASPLRSRAHAPALTAAQFASTPRPEPSPTPSEVSPADAETCSIVRENQRINLALALSDSDRRHQAVSCWRDLLNERPGHPVYAAKLIDCLMPDRRYEECRRLIDHLPAEIARLATFQLTLAEISVAEGRLDEASAIASEQSADPNSSPSLLVRAAQVLTACGEFAAAETCYTRSIKNGGGGVFAHAGLADLYWELDDVARSVAEARKALTIAPAYNGARFTLARSLHRTGQKSEAIVHFERCLENRWRPQESHSYLASLYWADDPVRAALHREMACVA